jgi:RNase P subunit RPR2
MTLKQLRCRLTCFFNQHSMHLGDMGHRDETGYLTWACQRCGEVQRVPYGLAVSGQITQTRIGETK